MPAAPNSFRKHSPPPAAQAPSSQPRSGSGDVAKKKKGARHASSRKDHEASKTETPSLIDDVYVFASSPRLFVGFHLNGILC